MGSPIRRLVSISYTSPCTFFSCSRFHALGDDRVTSCSAPRFSVIWSQSLTGDRTSHPSGSRPGQREAEALPLPAPGHCVAPENRRCQAMSKSAQHSVGGSRSSPTPWWLMTWAVPVPPGSAGSRAGIGQRPIRSRGCEPTPFAAHCPSHCSGQALRQTLYLPQREPGPVKCNNTPAPVYGLRL
jgi:hypothetical protein